MSLADDIAIFSDDRWDGEMAPPRPVVPAGTAPGRFSLPDTAVMIGSDDALLLFDRPIILTLPAVSGPIAWQAPGSDQWHLISRGPGSFEQPGSPALPGMFTVSDGDHTRVVSWRSGTFAALDGMSIQLSAPDCTNLASLTLNGEVRDGEQVLGIGYSLNGGPETALSGAGSGDLAFSIDLTLVEGTNEITVYADDAFGYRAAVTRSISPRWNTTGADVPRRSVRGNWSGRDRSNCRLWYCSH